MLAIVLLCTVAACSVSYYEEVSYHAVFPDTVGNVGLLLNLNLNQHSHSKFGNIKI